MLPHPASHAMLGSIESASMHVPATLRDPREGASRRTRVDGKPSTGARNPVGRLPRNWTAATKAQASRPIARSVSAHARTVCVVGPYTPGALHPERVCKSNRECRYLAFFEIIRQARLSERLAVRRFGRKLAQAQIRANGRSVVAARFRE